MILDSLPGYNVRVTTILLLAALTLTAHEIPSDIAVQAYVRPEGQRLRVVMRMPLKALRDVDFSETEQGFLDVEQLAPLLPDAATVWIAEFFRVYEAGRELPRPRVTATQVSLPSDRSFAGPRLTNSAHVFWDQLLFDVVLEYPIRSETSAFSVWPRLQHLAARVVTVVRFVPPGGVERDYEFPGDPGIVPLDPRWHQAARRFVELGFFHILDGTDHLLFLCCLVIPMRRFRPLLGVVTAFTVAHSITLLASAFGLAPDALWFPPLIETLIAASIVWMALENIASAKVHYRWLVAFAFGLVHGFGFSFALRQTLQFAGSHLLLSLLSFNLGVELGQLLVLAMLIPALHLLFRFVVAERMGTVILSALLAHTGWHWMLERADQLRRYRFEWPAVNAAVLAEAMQGLTLAWLAAGVAWAASRWWRRRAKRKLERKISPLFRAG
jgi:hypothetical protein